MTNKPTRSEKGLLETILATLERINDTHRLMMDRLERLEKRLDEHAPEAGGHPYVGGS